MKFVNTANYNILNENLFKLIVYENFLDVNFYESLDKNFPKIDEVEYSFFWLKIDIHIN